jgi:putative photosynthetic complex assembly protein 2
MPLGLISATVVYTLFLWWFSTGAILWLDRRPQKTYRVSLLAGLAVALSAVLGVVFSMGSATPVGAVIAFTSALLIWAWHELSFLTGLITGPNAAPCPPDASGGRRFVLAASTLIYHEIAIALTGAALVALSWGQPNRVGAWTFLILFACRLSAKLNLFLGVPNFTDSFFPDHLRHLTSYLKKGPIGAFFLASIAAGSALAGLLAWRALHANASAFDAVAFSLLFSLTALAIIEHAFMALPLPDAALWRWALPASENNPTPLPLDLSISPRPTQGRP